MTNENNCGNDKKKIWNFINPTVVITLVSWLTLAGFYIGVYRSEMTEFRRTINEVKINQITTQTDVIRVNAEGTIPHKKLESKIITLETKIGTLEGSKVSLDQHSSTVDKTLISLDTRIIRLEDNVPKIAVLSQMVESVKENQKEMKDDVKKIGEIQIQIIELKRLVEKLVGEKLAQK